MWAVKIDSALGINFFFNPQSTVFKGLSQGGGWEEFSKKPPRLSL
jgi:hypothetical protein